MGHFHSQDSIDLTDESLFDAPPPSRRADGSERQAMEGRLAAYGILPRNHALLSEVHLDRIEQLFVMWLELVDDVSRRRALGMLFASDIELREAVLPIVPLFFDALFFDDRTPTRDLVDLVLHAHRNWRRRLGYAE